jgi:hypothetical protein
MNQTSIRAGFLLRNARRLGLRGSGSDQNQSDQDEDRQTVTKIHATSLFIVAKMA